MATITISAPITPAWQRAIARATAQVKAGRKAERIAPRTYRVDASAGDGTTYTATVDSVVNCQVHCTCTAGQCVVICWHGVLAWEAAAAHIIECARQATRPAPATPAWINDEMQTPDSLQSLRTDELASQAAHRDVAAELARRADVKAKMARFAR